MANRLDALQAREYDAGGTKKTAFTKIGAAFEMKGGGWSVVLDAMPAPVDGQFKVLLMKPKPKEDKPAQQSASAGGFSRDLDDDIDF